MTILEINRRRQELAAELAKLDQEERRLDGLTSAQRVAEALHDRLCRSNHDDQCGWFYEDWNTVKKQWTRDDYLRRATAMLAAADNNETLVLNIIKAM